MAPDVSATRTLSSCGEPMKLRARPTPTPRYRRDQHGAPGAGEGVRSELVGPKDGLGAIGDRHERQGRRSADCTGCMEDQDESRPTRLSFGASSLNIAVPSGRGDKPIAHASAAPCGD